MIQLLGKSNRNRLTIAISIVVSLLAIGPVYPLHVYADDLSARSLKISDSAAATSHVKYVVTFTMPGITTIGSIRIQFCSNTSLVDDSCIAPTGFDDSDTAISLQTNAGAFSISNASTSNELLLTRPPTIEPSSTVSFTFDDITNPASVGSYFSRIYVYPSSDGSGPATYANGLAFAISRAVGINAEVPPYIKFCLGESITNYDCSTATEPFSDLGDLSPTVTSAAQSQMVIASNAQNGYSMWVMGATMMSGGNVINAMNGGTAVKGVSQFGLNLAANTTPVIGQNPNGPGSGGVTANYSQQNHFRFVTGDTLASTLLPDDDRKYTVSYIVNIPSGTPGGVYSTTLTYVCLANF